MYESETYLFDCPIYSNIEPSHRCFDNFEYVVNVSENLITKKAKIMSTHVT